MEVDRTPSVSTAVTNPRFVLLEEDKIGFNLTNVTRGDDGDYKCIVNLRSTSVRVKKKGTLNVTEPECLRVKRASDAGEQKCTCNKPPPESGEDEQRPATDSSGTANPVAVAVPVVIVIVIAAVAVVVFRKKCKSTGENQNVRSEVENGMVSQGLTQQEDSAV
ncbi:uncharacterized protein LOC124291984 [Haliotis rubra]|uniref:uncharacterized protein LOC124291984 n=1 Tax=Haliotis rubra TaxID=36100 RepID=UPI001EE5F4BF|nr:uncharacterized protein LOC124291984 [Haliotis rubra]